jgi:hypothetical protein
VKLLSSYIGRRPIEGHVMKIKDCDSHCGRSC